MRGLFNRVGRGVVAAAVVVMLAAPVQALPKDEGDRWSMPRVIKVIKKLVVRTFGDGILVPRP